MIENEVEHLIGTYYQDGIFTFGVEFEFDHHDEEDWKRFLSKNGYVDFFEIGNSDELQINCSFHHGYRNYDEPKYILEIADAIGTHEFYFLDSFLSLNDLLKQFAPMIDVAKHLEQRG